MFNTSGVISYFVQWNVIVDIFDVFSNRSVDMNIYKKKRKNHDTRQKYLKPVGNLYITLVYRFFWSILHPRTHINMHKRVSLHLSLPALFSSFSLLHSLHLYFAISIFSNEIYLASGEYPSAIRDNISYKYQPSSQGLCNIYEGIVAVDGVNSGYQEEVEHPSKVHQHMPTFWQARCLANPEAHLHVMQRSWLSWSHLACLSN